MKLKSEKVTHLSNISYSSFNREERIAEHLSNILQLNFDEALEYDITMFKKTLTDIESSPKSVESANEVLKRIIILISEAGIDITDYSSYGEKMLPIASMLTHGGSRILMVVPREEGLKLMEYLFKDCELKKRKTSTHDISYNKKKDIYEEVQGKIYGGMSLIANMLGKTKNYGLDLNIGGYLENDIHNEQIGDKEGATGKNGHLLVYTVITNNKCVVMFGIEGSAPGMDGVYGTHGFGTPNVLSAFGAIKMHKLSKAYSCNEYLIPAKNSLQINLDQDEAKLLNTNISEIQYDHLLLEQPVKDRGNRLYRNSIYENLIEAIGYDVKELIDNEPQLFKNLNSLMDHKFLNDITLNCFNELLDDSIQELISEALTSTKDDGIKLKFNNKKTDLSKKQIRQLVDNLFKLLDNKIEQIVLSIEIPLLEDVNENLKDKEKSFNKEKKFLEVKKVDVKTPLSESSTIEVNKIREQLTKKSGLELPIHTPNNKLKKNSKTKATHL